jgi:glutamyl-tRNA synthetase
MLAVVVDDHDMGITHIIRGDDHLTNAARQILLYQAFGWDIPQMAHIPLIHGPDGAKLSKRHGALGVDAYEAMGYLPEALCNYLVRLGWSHGDDEIISREESIKWFDLEHIGKSPSRIDFDKMNFVNAHYLREMKNDDLLEKILLSLNVSDQSKISISKALDALKPRATLLGEIVELAKIYIIERDPEISDESKEIIKNTETHLIQDVIDLIKNTENLENISEIFKEYAGTKNMKLGEIMKPIRCLITGMTNSPSVFEIINIIGRNASIKRLSREI